MATLNTTIDDVFKTTAAGSIDTAIGNVFYGVNHRQQPNAIPINKDINGLTFFTRPQLNLSAPNVRAERRLTQLLNKQEASIQRIIRCLLDPRLNNNGQPGNTHKSSIKDDPDNIGISSISSPFVDPLNAFIPVLTNHLISLSGWPDHVLETHTSKPGAYKEVFGYTDSNIDMYSAYDLTATFRNMQGDPISKLFQVWQIYQANVFQGLMSPYPDFIVNQEIDYNTRIYRLVLDKNKEYVQDISCTGAAFLISLPIGSKFNFESEKPMNETNSTIPITFRCFGSCYNDDILVHEFNKTVATFNPDMDDRRIKNTMKMISEDGMLLNMFNNIGYPRINPFTYKLEWYVSASQYDAVTNMYDRHLNAISQGREPLPEPKYF